MKPYPVEIRDPEGKKKEIPYGTKESLVAILFNPALKLTGLTLLRQDELARKVADSGDELLLEEEEYERIRAAIEAVEGLGRNDVEFVRRIIDAPKVDVSVK